MAGRSFVDTNVLVYAHDRSAGEKHAKAVALLADLWRERSGAVSTQVLQELYVSLRRKTKPPLPAAEAKRIVEDYLTWTVVVNDGDAILEAVALEERYRISFWDALVVQAARTADAATLYTEDLNDGQKYGEVTARNPFAA